VTVTSAPVCRPRNSGCRTALISPPRHRSARLATACLIARNRSLPSLARCLRRNTLRRSPAACTHASLSSPGGDNGIAHVCVLCATAATRRHSFRHARERALLSFPTIRRHFDFPRPDAPPLCAPPPAGGEVAPRQRGRPGSFPLPPLPTARTEPRPSGTLHLAGDFRPVLHSQPSRHAVTARGPCPIQPPPSGV
jgi:hypothetical protein